MAPGRGGPSVTPHKRQTWGSPRFQQSERVANHGAPPGDEMPRWCRCRMAWATNLFRGQFRGAERRKAAFGGL